MTSSSSRSSFTRPLRRVANIVAGPLGALASISTVVMMIAITADVVARNVFRQSLPGLLDLSETLLVATVFLGLAYAGAANAHVAVDLIASKVPPAVSRRMAGAMWLLGAGITVWFVYATTLRAIDSTERLEVTQGLTVWPLYPARWIIVVGLVAFLVVALVNAIAGLLGEPLLGEDDDAVESPASETKEVDA